MTTLLTLPQREVVSSDRRPWLGTGLILLGVGVAASALLGPLMFGMIDYHASIGAIDQVRGGDAAALFLVAPLSIIAGILALLGHRAAPVIGIGPAVFAAYMYAQLTVGGEFDRYPGNSEDFFLLNFGLFLLGTLVAVASWNSMDPGRLPSTSARVERILAVFLIVAAVFLLVGLHLPSLVAMWRGAPTDEYLADPNLFWLVKLMDLGIVAPALAAVAVGLLQHRAWANRAKYAAVGWFALLGSAVAGMAIAMQVTGAVGASIAYVIGFVVLALVGMAMAIVLYRPLFESPDRTGR
jgi:hypothetical protein